jgi:hypothetical protein
VSLRPGREVSEVRVLARAPEVGAHRLQAKCVLSGSQPVSRLAIVAALPTLNTEGNAMHDNEEEEEDMSAGREHAERRTAQARAAAPPENKARARKYPGKGNRTDWKKEV